MTRGGAAQSSAQARVWVFWGGGGLTSLSLLCPVLLSTTPDFSIWGVACVVKRAPAHGVLHPWHATPAATGGGQLIAAASGAAAAAPQQLTSLIKWSASSSLIRPLM